MNPSLPLVLPLVLLLLLHLPLTASLTPCPGPSALRCACHLTLPHNPQCQSLLSGSLDPCLPFRVRAGVDKPALLEALHETLDCAVRGPAPPARLLRTLSPEQERAILERIRGMVESILRQLNMGRSIEPGFRMVVQGEGRRRLKIARLVAYNRL